MSEAAKQQKRKIFSMFASALMQDQLLHAPIEQLGDVEQFSDGRRFRDPAELLELFSGLAQYAEHLAVQAELVDRPVGVGREQHLIGPGVMHSARASRAPWSAGRPSLELDQVGRLPIAGRAARSYGTSILISRTKAPSPSKTGCGDCRGRLHRCCPWHPAMLCGVWNSPGLLPRSPTT